MSKKNLYFCIFVLTFQSQVFAWENGRLTFPETQPVPLEIQKALQNAKPDKLPEFPAKSDDGKLQAEPQKVVPNGINQGTIVLNQNGRQTIIRNPRVDDLYKDRKSQSQSGFYLIGSYFSSVTSLLFSPDGNTLYAGTYGGGIRIIDVETAQETKLLIDPNVKHGGLAHQGSVNLLWHIQNPKEPKQWWLISAARDATIKIWDVQTNQLISSAGSRWAVSNYWKQENGEILAAANKVAFRIAPMQHKMIQKYSGHISNVVSMVYFNNQLWTQSVDQTVLNWNIQNPERITMYSQILNAAISADGQKVVTRFGDENFKIFNSSDGSLQTVLKEDLDNYSHFPSWNHLFLSKTGKYLAHSWTISGHLIVETTFQNLVTIWDLYSKKQIYKDGYFGANSIDWSDNEQFISSESQTTAPFCDLYILNIISKEKIGCKRSFNSLGDSEIQWVKNKPIYIESTKETDKTFGLLLHYGFGKKSIQVIGKFPNRKSPITQMSLSSDAKTVALLFKDELELIDVQTMKVLAIKKIDQEDDQLEFPSSYVLRFSDDSKSLLTWVNGSGTVWNASSLKKQDNANCKKEVMGFITSPRAVVCNNGNHIALLPMPKS
jgi:WD40 repeat protein